MSGISVGNVFQPVADRVHEMGADAPLAAAALIGQGIEHSGNINDSSFLGRMARATGRSLQSLSLGVTIFHHGTQLLSAPGALAASAIVVLTPLVAEAARSSTENSTVHKVVNAVETVVVLAAKVAQVALGVLIYGPVLAGLLSLSLPVASAIIGVGIFAVTFAPQLMPMVDFFRWLIHDYADSRTALAEWETVRQEFNNSGSPDSYNAMMALIVRGVQDKALNKGRKHTAHLSQIERVVGHELTYEQWDRLLGELMQNQIIPQASDKTAKEVADEMERILDTFIAMLPRDKVEEWARLKGAADPQDLYRLGELIARVEEMPAVVARDAHVANNGHGYLNRETARQVVQFIMKLVPFAEIAQAESLGDFVNEGWSSLVKLAGVIKAIESMKLPVPSFAGTVGFFVAAYAVALLINKVILGGEREVTKAQLIGPAREGATDYVYGRDPEIANLMRELADFPNGVSHPVVLGEHGVGRTSIVRGLAHRIASKDPSVPEALKDVKIYRIDTRRVMAERRNPQEVEAYVSELAKEIRGMEKQVILFFDDVDGEQSDKWNAFYQAVHDHIEVNAQHRVRIIAACTPAGLTRIRRENGVFANQLSAAPVNVRPFTDNQLVKLARERLRVRAPAVWDRPTTSSPHGDNQPLQRLIQRAKNSLTESEDAELTSEQRAALLGRVVNEVDQVAKVLNEAQEADYRIRVLAAGMDRADREFQSRHPNAVPGDAEYDEHFRQHIQPNQAQVDEMRERSQQEKPRLARFQAHREVERVWERRKFNAVREVRELGHGAEVADQLAKKLLVAHFVMPKAMREQGRGLARQFEYLKVCLDDYEQVAHDLEEVMV